MRKYLLPTLVVVFTVLIGAFIVESNTKKAYIIAIDKKDLIDSALLAKDSEYKFVFFGYAGCYHFCDPRLKLIDPIYKEIKKVLDLKMLFVDISDETTHEAAEAFAKETNSEFTAISPDTKGRLALQTKFKDLFISKMPDGDYLHSGFLYLLKRENGKYYLLKTYLRFDNSEMIIEDIKKITGH
jgi:cytochrome oxidase Cu insertion factor (SCO1/SenC/PrrC family)